MDKPMDLECYDLALAEQKLAPGGGNAVDYGFEDLSKKLFMVIHTHSGTDAQKVIEESWEICSCEAYRLLNVAYDPPNTDAGHQLVERVMAMDHWSITGKVQIDSMTREVVARTRSWRRRRRRARSQAG